MVFVAEDVLECVNFSMKLMGTKFTFLEASRTICTSEVLDQSPYFIVMRQAADGLKRRAMRVCECHCSFASLAIPGLAVGLINCE